MLTELQQTILVILSYIIITMIFILIGCAIYSQFIMNEKEQTLCGGVNPAIEFSENYIPKKEIRDLKMIINSITNSSLDGKDYNLYLPGNVIRRLKASLVIHNNEKADASIELLKNWLKIFSQSVDNTFSFNRDRDAFTSANTTSLANIMRSKYTLVEAVLSIFYATGSKMLPKDGNDSCVGRGAYNMVYVVQFDKPFECQVSQRNKPYIEQVEKNKKYILKVCKIDDYIMRYKLSNNLEGHSDDDELRLAKLKGFYSEMWYHFIQLQDLLSTNKLDRLKPMLSKTYINSIKIANRNMVNSFIDYKDITKDTPFRSFWSVEQAVDIIQFNMCKPTANNLNDRRFFDIILMPYFNFMFDFNNICKELCNPDEGFDISFHDWKISNIGFINEGVGRKLVLVDVDFCYPFNIKRSAPDSGGVYHRFTRTHYIDYCPENVAAYKEANHGLPPPPSPTVFNGIDNPFAAAFFIIIREMMNILRNTSEKDYYQNMHSPAPNPLSNSGENWADDVRPEQKRSGIGGVIDILQWTRSIVNNQRTQFDVYVVGNDEKTHVLSYDIPENLKAKIIAQYNSSSFEKYCLESYKIVQKNPNAKLPD